MKFKGDNKLFYFCGIAKIKLGSPEGSLLFLRVCKKRLWVSKGFRPFAGFKGRALTAGGADGGSLLFFAGLEGHGGGL